ncbi:GGDEF domain-containing protein [Lysinibacillus yapensis]|uniref:GGDEF domain-containing protein n=1 Tax=Ureibacillus yapensis TaxID=2304605 RepID=A0A396S4H2_9BACL|nr:sensor domain-containing diguanylate cyclase [Lysinibacillus yapensis]RHW34052.1 GGDEF domain-containing protein [Lysinibacillus yapensis]
MLKTSNKITLKSLIIGVIALAFLLSIASSILSSYQGTIKLLKEQSLETNRVYSQKLSQMVDVHLSNALKVLEYSSMEMASSMDDEETLIKEASRLQQQELTFNSVTIANEEGLILAGAPIEFGLKGKTITSEEGIKTIKNQKPTITKPYTASTGRVLITISYPIFSQEGRYEGLINGTIYLHDSNFFNMILGEHYYNDGSYVFVVDKEGRIIYHQNPERVGDVVSENEVVKRLMNGESGAQVVTNTLGTKMLAGYSSVENTHWGVVAQTPQSVALNSVEKLVLNMFLTGLPLLLVAIFFAIFAAGKIAKPLQSIANMTEESVKESEMEKLIQLNAWYYEARQIKNAMIKSFSFLHGQVNLFMDKSTIDPLTGVMNRRTLEEILQTGTEKEEELSAIMLDIDHFKSINDIYGHAVGDEVLKYFAEQMKKATREQDLCFRFGGEEFIILLPETNARDAYMIAERLRKALEKTDSPFGRPVTFSAGVASFPEMAANSTELLELADKALYEAKKAGRNRVIIFNH